MPRRFQLLKALLNVKLPASNILDYLGGVYYWLHVGLLSIFDVLAPILFLVFGIFFMKFDGARYLVVYLPIFLMSITFYLAVMKRYRYGLREFIYHQGIQFLVSLPATIAFFEWVLKRRKGFKVTPKGKARATFTRYHIYYVLIVVVLAFAISIGIQRISSLNGVLFYAYFVNLFWAGWWLLVSISALYVSLSLPVSRRFGIKISQAYEGLEENVLVMLNCAETLERAISNHYLQASKRFKEFSEPLETIAMESFKHAETYLRLQKSIKLRLKTTECKWIEPYIEKINRAKESENLIGSILLHEETLIRIFSQLIFETCRGMLENINEIAKIIDDETRHERILTGMLEKSNSA